MIRLDTTTANLLAALSRLRTGLDHLDANSHKIVHALKNAKVEAPADPAQDLRKLREDLEAVEQSVKALTLRLERSQELISTSALLSSTLDSSQVLEKVIDTIIKLSGAERAYLMLRGDGSDDLTVRAARNYDKETISPEEASFSKGMVNTAIERREIVLSTNATADVRFAELESVMDYTLRSVLVIPMILREEVIGALYADNRMKDGQFKKELLPLMTAFASQAAIAIENAHLFSQIKADLAAAKSEVRSLRIQIDPDHAEREISDIIEGDFFKRLQDLARSANTTEPDSSGAPTN